LLNSDSGYLFMSRIRRCKSYSRTW